MRVALPSEMRPTHDLWARVVWGAIDLGRQAGMSNEVLFAGLPFDAITVRQRKRVQWDDYCTIVERIADHAGGATELEDLLEASYHGVYPELRMLAGALIGPRPFVRFVVDVVNPLLFPPIESKLEELADDRVRISLVLRVGARPCEPYFRGTVGSLRGLLCHIDLPPIEVLDASVGGDHLIVDARLPASRTLGARARETTSRAMRWLTARFVLGHDADGTPVSAVVGDLDPDPVELRIAHAIASWKLTRRQADVLRHLVAGRANKEIAKALSTAENTIELHVTALLRKTGLTSRTQLIARFWSVRD
jgi:DNA-binding CsgD family transcriptional regulator